MTMYLIVDHARVDRAGHGDPGNKDYASLPEDDRIAVLARAFYDELCSMLASQVAAPNSPQWFNTGLHYAYGLSGPAQGHYYVDADTGILTRASSAYERPQPHACQPYHALVSTPEGPLPIGQIVTKHLVGLEVYDGRTEGTGTTRVVAVQAPPAPELAVLVLLVVLVLVVLVQMVCS